MGIAPCFPFSHDIDKFGGVALLPIGLGLNGVCPSCPPNWRQPITSSLYRTIWTPFHPEQPSYLPSIVRAKISKGKIGSRLSAALVLPKTWVYAMMRLIGPVFFLMSLTTALGYGSLFSQTGVQSFFIMILCTFIGFWSACRVNSAFHAPLMGLTNAMSSMILFLAVTFYGALSGPSHGFLRAVTTITIFFLAMNLTGGLFITRRMLSLFSTNKTE